MSKYNIKLLFTLFALSGFTGLIYESIWTHYLKLFLGAAAFAQSFVLAAFMGGMAFGAWLASRSSKRTANLLRRYAWIEVLIGIAALVFHEIFILLTNLSLDHVIPVLGSPVIIEFYKYALCAILIVPQTILLGMTFPLMSGAVIRRGPNSSGHHLSMLYFTNSAGAAIGALAVAFLLLGWLGMPGTMRFAGVINLALAAAVFVIARQQEPTSYPMTTSQTSAIKPLTVKLFLLAAFVTGAASFIYEIAWIRMLSLVLGASFQAFEVMLSAFITGLALGGYWIRRRIDSIKNPLLFAGWVQFAMGLAALCTIFVYHNTFDWMAWALSALQRSENAYPLFNIFSHAIAFAVMLPATFFAGMTLPLFTQALLRGGYGERSIGQVYAFNTLGAIAGILLAVHILLPGIGVKLAIVIGASADILLGGYLLRYSGIASRKAQAFAAILVGLLAATVTARAGILTPERLSSGVFRHGKAVMDNQKVHFYRDGKTASVSVLSDNKGHLAIVTNGKPDAAINMGDPLAPSGDEYTMTLLGSIPMLIKPDAKTIANIGWGSGMTTDAILSHRGPRVVNTIEIEKAMVEGARAFSTRFARPYRDSRSRVHFEDAKSYFARHRTRYDIIISEPSNPWVNGVASLFTTEFYRDAKRYLSPGGLFVQWLQTYEFSDELLGSVLSALAENFSDFHVYESASDIIVIAVADGMVPVPSRLPEAETEFLKQLQRIGVNQIEDVTARLTGDRKELMPLFAESFVRVNSDFQPFVQLGATRARFRNTQASAIFDLMGAPIPVLEMLSSRSQTYLKEPVSEAIHSYRMHPQSVALELHRGLTDRQFDPLSTKNFQARLALLTIGQPGALCGSRPSNAALAQLHEAAKMTLTHLSPHLRQELWVKRKWLTCKSSSLSEVVRSRLDLYAAIASNDGKAMLQRARVLLRESKQGEVELGQFFLLTAMLGAELSGERDQARQLWKAHNLILYADGKVPPHVTYVANMVAR